VADCCRRADHGLAAIAPRSAMTPNANLLLYALLAVVGLVVLIAVQAQPSSH
jgi:hypothetical protein